MASRGLTARSCELFTSLKRHGTIIMTFTPAVRRLESRAITHGTALVVGEDGPTIGQRSGRLLTFEFRPYHILTSEKGRPGLCGSLQKFPQDTSRNPSPRTRMTS